MITCFDGFSTLETNNFTFDFLHGIQVRPCLACLFCLDFLC